MTASRGGLLLALLWPLAGHASTPAIAGFEVGMDAAAVERVLETSKAASVRRTKFGPPANKETPGEVAGALATIKVGPDCGVTGSAGPCEQLTVFFARPDIGGRMRGVESVRFPSAGLATQSVVDELQRTYGKARLSHTYPRKVIDTEYSVLSLLWGGATDRMEAKDAFFPINAGETQRIGGKYVYAEIWQNPDKTVRRVRLAAGDDELNSQQAAAWSGEWDKQRAAERQRWRACVDKSLEAQRDQPAVPAGASQQRILGYRGLGRVRFTLPDGMGAGPAVPHFTAGPRLMGGDGCIERFEVHVLSYREPQTPARVRAEMEDKLRGVAPVKSLEGNDALLYATQTTRNPDAEYRHVTYGALAAGRALIRFEHHSNEESQARLGRLMRVVASAEFLDSDKWPAWEQMTRDLERDEEAWRQVELAYGKQDFGVAYAGAKKLCDQWTAARTDIESRTLAGNACLHAAVMILVGEHAAAGLGPGRELLERALLAYGDAKELLEHRQSAYANLAVIHGLGLGVPEDLALARGYYAKEETLQSTLKMRDAGKVGPRTLQLLRKLGH